VGRHRFALVAVLAASGALLLASCGGSSGASSSGVASLGSSSKKASSSKSSKSSEQQLLSWVQCMRKQGVNLPDPTVDANGNLTLRPAGGGGGGFGGGGFGGGGAGSSSTPTTVAGGAATGSTGATGTGTGATGAQNPRRTQFEAATKACGNPPQGAFGGFNRQNSQEFQDAALKFAQCMRKNGVNMPDPNFSSGNGAGAGGPGGFFRNINRNDPNTQKALQACQSIIAGLRRGGSNTSTTVAS
jgi:hypothetical protein